jgi:hypothetical protein
MMISNHYFLSVERRHEVLAYVLLVVLSPDKVLVG